MIKKKSSESRIQSAKYISPNYMHVDGTSFSAPVVSAVIAQLLEADPMLTSGTGKTNIISDCKTNQGHSAGETGIWNHSAEKSHFKSTEKRMYLKTKRITLV